jgi:hypothetical protein
MMRKAIDVGSQRYWSNSCEVIYGIPKNPSDDSMKMRLVKETQAGSDEIQLLMAAGGIQRQGLSRLNIGGLILAWDCENVWATAEGCPSDCKFYSDQLKTTLVFISPRDDRRNESRCESQRPSGLLTYTACARSPRRYRQCRDEPRRSPRRTRAETMLP